MEVTKTTLEEIFLAWSPRVGATLSLLASAVLLKLVFTKKHVRKLSWEDLKPNNRFIFMLGVIEAVHSLAYLTSTSAIPKNNDIASPNVYGAAGNHTSCLVQGFVIQLGLAAPLYSASLSVFYWLTICRGLSQQEFRKAKTESLLHGVSILVPLVTATTCAALDVYGPRGSVCWIGVGRSWYSFVFVGLIVLVSWIIISSCMIFVFLEVKGANDKMLKYSFGLERNSPSKADQRMQREKNDTAIHAFLAIFTHFLVYIFCPFITSIFDLVGQEVPAVLTIVQSTLYSMRGFLIFFTLTRPMIVQAVQGGKAIDRITMAAAYYKLLFDQRSLVQLMARMTRKEEGANRRRKQTKKQRSPNSLLHRARGQVKNRGLRYSRGSHYKESSFSAKSKEPRTGSTTPTQQCRMAGKNSAGSPYQPMQDDAESSMMLSWNPFYLCSEDPQDFLHEELEAQKQLGAPQSASSLSYSANEEEKEEIRKVSNSNSSFLPKKRLYNDNSIVVIEHPSSSHEQGAAPCYRRQRRHSLMSLASVMSEDEQEDIDDASEEDGLVSTGLFYRRRSVNGGGKLKLDKKTRQSLLELDAAFSEEEVSGGEEGGAHQGGLENKNKTTILAITEEDDSS